MSTKSALKTAQKPGTQKRGLSRDARNNLTAYSFIAPNFIGFCIFTLIPMVFAIGLSFCNWDGQHAIEFVGLKNFLDLAGDKTFKTAFVNTIVYCVGTVPLTLVCSLGLALLLNQNVKLRNFFRTVSFFPYVASLVVYQLGGLLLGQVGFGLGTVTALVCLAGMIYLLVRKNKYGENHLTVSAVAAAAR